MDAREEANRQLAALVKTAQECIDEAKQLAEANSLEFTIELDKPHYFREVQTLEWAASTSCEWETSDEYSYSYKWSETEYD